MAAAPAPPRPGLLTWPRAVGTVLAVLLLALWLHTEQLRQSLALHGDALRALRAPHDVRLFSLSGVGSGAGALGTVILDADARQAAVAIRDLPPNTPEQVYRLWAEIGDRTVACGNFATDEDGAVQVRLELPVALGATAVRALLVTREPVNDDPAPRGPVILRSG